MILSPKTITFALILLFMLSALGIAVEQAAEEEIEVSRLLDEIKLLKKRIVELENASNQARTEVEQGPKPLRHTSNSDIDIDPEKHRLEIERHLTQHEIDIEAQKQKLELEQDLAHAQAEQQRNIITFSAEQESETTKFQYEMEQSVQEREYEMKREVERARIEQEQEIQEREIERNLVIETTQIEQHGQVQEADIERNAMIEKAHIEKYTTVQLAEMDAELERHKKELKVIQEMQKVKEEIAAIETEHRKKIAELTKLAVFPLNVNASEIANLVEPFLSEHATMSVDDEGKVLVIRDLEDCVKDAEMIVEKLNVLRTDKKQETK